MNTTGFIRGLMSKNVSNEDYLKHVTSTVEQQLQEWDPEYKVFVMKLSNYEIIVKKEFQYYQLSLPETELSALQNKSPYSLDKKIWSELVHQGLHLEWGPGNYLEYVFR
ncbi:hypothetical protein J2S74_004497 [Evansella vedderi]|uniref:Uncharacterized protein n=1 Tax=Evansella vedderi TaxID=38282 RepID=A0ABU0A242_9BACI|nr:hypothetical protein [Evansella vedderi]MDQ0257052.1 hypothetical protein [Evansella vedderi]